jgi:hypothetical protein
LGKKLSPASDSGIDPLHQDQEKFGKIKVHMYSALQVFNQGLVCLSEELADRCKQT